MGIEESKLSELHEDIAYYADLFRRGKISCEEYNDRTKDLIGNYYRRYRVKENKDSGPYGILGILLSAIKRLF